MSTTPTPIPTVTIASSVSAFLKLHERLILVLALAGLSFVGYNKWLSYQVEHDKKVSDTATATAQAQATSNALLAQQAVSQQAQYLVLATQLAAENKSLKSAQVVRDTNTTKQQAADLAMPLPELGSRWLSLLQFPAGVSFISNQFTVTPDVAQKTVTQLEQIPTLTADLAGERTIEADQDKVIQASDALNKALSGQVDGLNLEITKDNTASADQIKLLKAQAKKGKLKWFLAGFGVGLATRGLIKIFAGI